MTLTKRTDTPEAKAFWENVAKAASFFHTLPQWKRDLLISGRVSDYNPEPVTKERA